jgi:hypothetical protein
MSDLTSVLRIFLTLSVGAARLSLAGTSWALASLEARLRNSERVQFRDWADFLGRRRQRALRQRLELLEEKLQSALRRLPPD